MAYRFTGKVDLPGKSATRICNQKLEKISADLSKTISPADPAD
jgi:hypothetical protein